MRCRWGWVVGGGGLSVGVRCRWGWVVGGGEVSVG